MVTSSLMQPPTFSKYTEFQQQYIYTPLSKISLGTTDPYNIYGVVIDASIPYVKNKCTCSVRVIDQSLNLRAAEMTSKGAISHIQCQMFANDTKTLPHIIHIGDIIRIHRANVSSYNEQK